MTALEWIIKEAKALRKKFPKRFKTWTEYVKQASAIYATKHKGKSPVGKKKATIKKRVVKSTVKKVVSGTKLQKGELVLRNKPKTISENKVLSEIEKVKKIFYHLKNCKRII